MAIVVKHGGNPAPALVGAYGAGIGKRQAEDARQQAQLAAAEEAQRKSLEAQQREAALNREFTLGRDEAGQERSLETMRLSADLREGSAEAEQLRRREDVEWGYTTQQKQKDEQYREALASIQTDESMRPSEKLDAIQQIEAIRRNIKPIANWTQKRMTPEERLKTSTTTLPDGTVVSFDADGTPRTLVASPGKVSVADIAKVMKEVTASLTTEDPDTSERTVPSNEDVEAGVRRILEMHKRVTGGAASEGSAVATAGSKWAAKSGTPKKKVVTGAAKWKD